MTPADFLRAVADAMPGEPSQGRAAQMARYAARLGADFPAGLSRHTAGMAGRQLRGFPTWDELRAVLAEVLPSPEDGRGDKNAIRAASWERYIRRRLSEGGDGPLLLSLLRDNCPPQHLRAVMAQCFPQQLREQDAFRDTLRAEQAQGLDAIRARVRRAMMAPGPPRQGPAQRPEPERPAIQPAPLAPAHMVRELRRVGQHARADAMAAQHGIEA